MILGRYAWLAGGRCFKCRKEERFVTEIGVRGEGAVERALLMCGSCVLAEEEARLGRMRRRRRLYVPGRIGRRE
ncbi:hypothetical protein C1I97_03325 [Streptomyces sp. NTH33]|nr:hypothetical protein C1I97_03325 [Streptomyces sp. NTH33]